MDKLKEYSKWCQGILLLSLIINLIFDCTEIIQHTDGALGFVTEIETQYSSVTTKTAELHRSCQELVKQEVSNFNLVNHSNFIG